MISELNLTENQKQARNKAKAELGYWLCDKCATKYYLGVICDTCLVDEVKNSLKGMRVK